MSRRRTSNERSLMGQARYMDLAVTRLELEISSLQSMLADALVKRRLAHGELTRYRVAVGNEFRAANIDGAVDLLSHLTLEKGWRFVGAAWDPIDQVILVSYATMLGYLELVCRYDPRTRRWGSGHRPPLA